VAARFFSLAFGSVAALFVSACGGGEARLAEKNHVFYAFDSASPELVKQFETPYPPLDLKAATAPDGALNPGRGDYRGVTVLDGKVHLSRLADWHLRSATNEPGKRYVSYVSPREYVFALYEWPDPPDTPWRDVLAHFEDAVKAEHAEIVEKPVPIATWNAQGRAYVVRRRVPAAKTPYVNTSLEVLARAEKRIVLVQIVHQGESLAPESKELLRVINTLELL
jgi:hypothetical protein